MEWYWILLEFQDKFIEFNYFIGMWEMLIERESTSRKLLATLKKNDVYIVARNSTVQKKLNRYQELSKVFQENNTAVYKLAS